LLVGSEGKLSKRLGSLGVSTFRDEGLEPVALLALLARIGTSDPVEPVTAMEPLIASFDFSRFGRAPARFDEAELGLLNQKILHLLDFKAVQDRLPAGMGEAAWLAIRPNLVHLNDVATWWTVVTGPFSANPAVDDDRDFLAQAADTLGAMPFGEGIWRELTNALKDASGRKGKALFLPLRLALTGAEHGPDMAALLPLIGQDEAVQRLRNASAA
jgi:glutamyl-tRNA synthetase